MRWGLILVVLTVACDGGSDDTAACEETVWYVDADADGFGVEDDTLESCSPGQGYSETSGDCDDANAAVAPGVDEVCDELDNNCDQQVDEGLTSTFYADTDEDGHGDPAASVVACQAPAGHVVDDIDCDDTDATVFEGAPEVCDGIDNDCDDAIDDADPDAVGTVWYADTDGDGYGDAGVTVTVCVPPKGYISGDSTDCDDAEPSAHPGAKEICDGIDNDCDKVTVEDCASCGDLQVLTYFDSFHVGSSPIEDAAAILGMDITVTKSGGDFAAGLATADVVVVDVPGSGLPSEVVDGVGEVIGDGRYLLFSWWNLSSDTKLQSTLGVSVGYDLKFPGAMYPTTEGAALWEGLESVPDPMTGSDDAGLNGQINTPLDSKTSEMLALYDDDVKTPAILSVFDGAVIVNGYLPWDFRNVDADGDKVSDAAELYVNELAWITACVP